ncbi:Gfo/Idh/MocA family oxidoreductase [Chitinispirillales bacterium ANBcel5]|uniref:Gfo/Idh/MocA family protein n=1 Tax=Cellulosispirillum alkaliphilum TaxID=3039283 RepID=UPI002A5712DB|nr:Gfo/Idh/MocA family oxidoreductase [Chitinispirillales bacterium ANBcel5]
MTVETKSITQKLNLAFIGLGWIGYNRMQAVLGSGLAQALYLSDTQPCTLSKISENNPYAYLCTDSQQIDYSAVDGVVIATPSALHGKQTIDALEAGCSVFCQKPLARTAGECREILDTARIQDKLLGVDFSYRHLKATSLTKELLKSGDIGEIYAVDACFHNAYGPDKEWFYNPSLSGGGCVMDLGIHMVDTVLYLLDEHQVKTVSGKHFSKGKPVSNKMGIIEDHSFVQIGLENNTNVQIACSWNLNTGCDAVINITLFGTRGSLCIKNVNGSFYDFTLERYRGTSKEVLLSPPDDWGGRAIVEWAQNLYEGKKYDPEGERLYTVSQIIDSIYGR